MKITLTNTRIPPRADGRLTVLELTFDEFLERTQGRIDVNSHIYNDVVTFLRLKGVEIPPRERWADLLWDGEGLALVAKLVNFKTNPVEVDEHDLKFFEMWWEPANVPTPV